MAHKKGMGSTRNGRESESKRLGVKIFGGQEAISGNIIVRQRGTRFHPGANVGLGKDHTLFALTDGLVMFTKKRNDRNYVSVVSREEYVAAKGVGAVKTGKASTNGNGKATASATTSTETESATGASSATETAEAPAPATEETPKANISETSAPDDNSQSDAEKLIGKIGAAPEDAKEDLKMINGIGPAYETKLNNVGIYTYEQISKLTDEDLDTLADVSGIGKNKMVEEDWVAQAQKLIEDTGK